MSTANLISVSNVSHKLLLAENVLLFIIHPSHKRGGGVEDITPIFADFPVPAYHVNV